MGCKWSKSDSCDPVPIEAPTPRAVTPPTSARVCRNLNVCTAESGEEGNRNDEHLFFETFFLVLHRVRGYQGTLQRWRNDLQRARREGTHILDWPYIWRKDGIGYLQTLRLVQELVQDEPFTPADLVKLEASAQEVVRQRGKEYHHAQLRGTSNWSHRKVLLTWAEVLENLEAAY